MKNKKLKINRILLLGSMIMVLMGWAPVDLYSQVETGSDPKPGTSIILLGTIQDAGSPQISCQKECCTALFENPDHKRRVISLGLYDASTDRKYLFEATPNIGSQLRSFSNFCDPGEPDMVDGIFLTHAHIGHYTGLMYLGKEAMDAKEVPVFVMPRFKEFLLRNGPWDQLVSRNNISLVELADARTQKLSQGLEVVPFLVPHRDEYSETVGYRIKGPNKTALFIPDIDKWSKWGKDIVEEIRQVDYAFVDASFYSGTELNNRDMSEIPHPFVVESMASFEKLEKAERKKIIFIHFNHTNPLLNLESKEARSVIVKGYRIGQLHEVFEL